MCPAQRIPQSHPVSTFHSCLNELINAIIKENKEALIALVLCIREKFAKLVCGLSPLTELQVELDSTSVFLYVNVV